MSTATPVHIVVAGKVNDPSYQQAKVAKRLSSSNSNVSYEALPFFETDWEEFAKKIATKFESLSNDRPLYTTTVPIILER